MFASKLTAGLALALAMLVAGARAETGAAARPEARPGDLEGLEFVPGEIVLDFEDHLGNAECFARAAALGVRDAGFGSPTADLANLVVGRVPVGSSPRSLAARARELPGVEAAGPNFVYRALYLPDDPRFGEQWHMTQIRAHDAWDVARGRGVVVAVLDTGVTLEKDPANPQVAALEDLENTGMVPGYDFINNRVCAIDDHAHGNHVAGTIAQSTNNGKGVAGIAYEARIMPVKVLSRYGSGTTAGVANGIRFAADHGADVINMSLGGGPEDEVMKSVCAKAKAAGVLIVCAAGNESSPFVSFPAAYPGCVAVSSVNSIKQKAFYSNWGEEIAIAAPGGDRDDHNGDGIPDGVLQQTIEPGNPSKPAYLSFIGTSMASPHAAGVAALVKSLGVTKPEYTLWVMQQTAEPLENPGKGNAKENFFGAGLVDARRAVDRIALWFSLQKLVLVLVLFLVLKRSSPVKPGIDWCPFHLVGIVVGATGLFFLPYLGVGPFPLQELVCRGFPEWDLYFLGAQGHANPLFYSALVPIALLVLLFRAARPVRALVAGLALGMAGHMAWYALVPVADVHWVPDLVANLGDRFWYGLQAGLCLLASGAMRLGEER